MSITPSRCQGCGASLDPVQAGAVCPYCGRTAVEKPVVHAHAEPSAAPFTPVPAEDLIAQSKPSWFESCLAYFNRAMSRFARFSGRASRAEYWYFFLAVLLLNVMLMLLGLVFSESVLGDLIELLSSVLLLFVLIPSISIGVRRLHDVNKSGWWYLLIFVPLVGPLVLLYWAIQVGDASGNAYGDPEV